MSEKENPSVKRPRKNLLSRWVASDRHHPAWQKYLCATFWAGLALLTRFSLHPILGEETRFGLYIPFILLVAWRSGVGPSLWTAAVSLCFVLLFFRDGLNASPGSALLVIAANYIAPAVFGIYLIESLFQSRMAAEAEAERRRHAEAELEKARLQLRDYAIDLEKTVQARTSELNEAVGFLENFCYSIAHDLRGPIRAVSGFSDILELDHKAKLDDEALRCLDRIQQASKRMDRLITGLLDYGRVSHVPLSLQEIDLGPVIAEAVRQRQVELDRAGASIEVPKNPGAAFANATLLSTVLAELIQNTTQFRRKDEPLRVRIETSPHEHTIRLCVRDNGVGIPAEYQDRVFSLFETLSPPDAEHIGFGLAFVTKAVERMHGAVGVESQPDHGTAVWIDLPRRDWRRTSPARPEGALER